MNCDKSYEGNRMRERKWAVRGRYVGVPPFIPKQDELELNLNPSCIMCGLLSPSEPVSLSKGRLFLSCFQGKARSVRRTLRRGLINLEGCDPKG